MAEDYRFGEEQKDDRFWERQDNKRMLQEYLGYPEAYEVYYLWYEYLKRNDYYKTFCEWFFNNWDKLFQKRIGKTRNQYTYPSWDQPIIPVDQWQNVSSLPAKLKQCDYFKDLFTVFKYWGFVHDTSWDDILDYICYHINQEKKSSFMPKVVEYSPLRSFERYVQTYRKISKKEPTIDQIKSAFQIYETHFQQGDLLLNIKIDAKIEEIQDQFIKIVSERQKKFIPEEKVPFPKPCKKLTKKAILTYWEYLDIYDVRIENPKATWWDTINILEQRFKRKYRANNADIVVMQKYNKAIKLIKNTSENKFPYYK